MEEPLINERQDTFWFNGEKKKKRCDCGVLGWKRWCCISFIIGFTLVFLCSMIILIVAYVVKLENDPIRIVPIEEAMDVPDAPNSPILIQQKIQSITVAWNEPYHHLSIITEYIVQFSEPGENFTTHQPGPGILLQYELTNLRPGTEYRIRVCAVNALGPGNFSDISIYTTLNATIPDPPSAPYIYDSGTSFISVRWIPGSDNGAVIDGFELQVALSQNETEIEWETVYIGLLNFFDVRGLSTFTYYLFRCRTSSRIGHSPWSEQAEYHSNSDGAWMPDLTTSITVVERRCDSVSIIWPRPDDHGAEILYYSIEVNSFDHNASLIQFRNPVDTTESAIIYELLSLNIYILKIRAHNIIGIGPEPFGLPLPTRRPSPTEKPSAPIVISATATSIGTKWTEPTLNCAPVSLYILEIDDWWHGLSFAPNYTGLNMEHLNKDLLPAVTYNFRLKTETEYGESEYSDITTMKTFDKGACGNQQDVQIVHDNLDRMAGVIQRCLILCAIPGTICSIDCVVEELGLSENCAYCWIEEGMCELTLCTVECFRPASEECLRCTQEKCYPETVECTGMPSWTFPT